MVALILIGFNYRVTSYDPNDDLIDLLSKSIDEDKIDLVWESTIKEDKKTVIRQRRFIFIPADNSLYKKLKYESE